MTRGAWYRYPEPDGRGYSLSELHDAATVEELFDYCQILVAKIDAEGWRELYQVHGRVDLLEISRLSGWCDDETELVYQARLAGYDPESDQFGTYEESTGVFKARDSEHT